MRNLEVARQGTSLSIRHSSAPQLSCQSLYSATVLLLAAAAAVSMSVVMTSDISGIMITVHLHSQHDHLGEKNTLLGCMTFTSFTIL